MKDIRISLTLICSTPPSVGAGGAHGTIADKVVTRNAGGQFIIPASQVKGKLRHACEQLLRTQGVSLCRPPQPEEMCPHNEDVAESPCLLCKIFGSPEFRSALRFHDLTVAKLKQPHETMRPMVSINRRRRTAEAQRLFLVETAPNFQGLEFTNDAAITGIVSDDAHAHVLLAGLKILFAWGGGASRGLGWAKIEAKAWFGDQRIEFQAEEIKQLCRSSK
jgi:CRISPR/Cas system CSM-associated protein Csm3 (group 7 of RAMP superfamily)